MKFKDIDSVKKKTMSCLPKGCLSLKRDRKKSKRGMKEGMTEEEVKEEYIQAYSVSGVSSVPNGTVKCSSGSSGEKSEQTFEPSYHVYRSVSHLFILYFFASCFLSSLTNILYILFPFPHYFLPFPHPSFSHFSILRFCGSKFEVVILTGLFPL